MHSREIRIQSGPNTIVTLAASYQLIAQFVIAENEQLVEPEPPSEVSEVGRNGKMY